MKNLLGYLTCVAVAILLRVYINGSGGTLVLYLLAIAFVISLAALLITKRKLVESFMAATSLRLVMRSAARDITKAIAKR